MTWMAEDDNGSDFVVPPFIIAPDEDATRATLDYWSVSPTGDYDADIITGRSYFDQTVQLASGHASYGIIACVLSGIAAKGVYGALEIGWLRRLAAAALVGGMPDPVPEDDVIGAAELHGRHIEMEDVRDAENRACLDLLCERNNPDQIVCNIHEIITTGTPAMKAGYLGAICRAAYAGSRH